ncbi:MAG: hypothetical protein QG635_799 [Bacteroidota bacterium]|nr:hypothetical protein [Bacteroidota bacterium]
MFKCFRIIEVILLIILTNNLYNQQIAKEVDIKLKSKAFAEGEMIPKKYSCDGKNISPELSWSGIPAGAKSIAIVCDDPDAPSGEFVHWVIYNIPASATKLEKAIPTKKNLPNGALQGTSDARKIGYTGPCPPGELHRYFFTIYALDVMLNLDAGAAKDRLFAAMRGHILGEGKLMGKYKR